MLRISRLAPALLILTGCTGATSTPSSNAPVPSLFAKPPLASSSHCPRYKKGSGLLADGDFHDSPDPGGGYFTFNKGQRLAPKWKVTKLDVNLIGTTFWNFAHLCSVDLDGESAVGGIEHVGLQTEPGAKYTLTFLMSGNDYCGPVVKKMKVSAGNDSVVFSWNDAHGHSAEKGKFAARQMSFTAAGTASVLKFTSLDTAGSGCGPVIGALAVAKR